MPVKSKVVKVSGMSSGVIDLSHSGKASNDLDFKETGLKQHAFAGAKPKVLARPATASAKQ